MCMLCTKWTLISYLYTCKLLSWCLWRSPQSDLLHMHVKDAVMPSKKIWVVHCGDSLKMVRLCYLPRAAMVEIFLLFWKKKLLPYYSSLTHVAQLSSTEIGSKRHFVNEQNEANHSQVCEHHSKWKWSLTGKKILQVLCYTSYVKHIVNFKCKTHFQRERQNYVSIN